MKHARLFMCVAMVCLGGLCVSAGAADDPSKVNGGRQVQALIEKIEAAPPLKEGQAPRVEKVREDALNAYIVRRIASVRDSLLSELKLKLFNDNGVKGSFTLDFTGMDIPVFLSSQMTFRFAGHIETHHGKGRFLVSDLRLRDEPVTVEFLDMVLAVMASLNEYEPPSFQDWYELPYGILDIRTTAGSAEVSY